MDLRKIYLSCNLMLFLLIMNTTETEAARERRSKGGTKPREMLDEKAMKALSLQQLKKFDINVLQLWTNRLNLRQGSSTVMATAIHNHYHPNIETTPPVTDDEGSLMSQMCQMNVNRYNRRQRNKSHVRLKP